MGGLRPKSMSLSAPNDSPAAERQREEILGLTLDTLSTYTTATCLANLGFSGMTVAVAWSHADHASAIGWFVGILVLSVVRCKTSKLSRLSRFRLSNQAWLHLFTLFSGLSGVAWGVGSWILFGQEDILSRAFYTFIVAGLVSGAATTNAVHRPAFLAYVSSAGGLLAIRMLSFDGGVDQVLGLMSALAVALYLRLGLLNHRLFKDSFELRRSNVELISRLEEAHLALESTNASLERRVEERTNSLECEIQARFEAERQLRRSHRMEAVGRLTGGIAHDFNNVLTVILNCLELVQTNEKEDKVMVSHAKSAATRGAALTEQLLAFSRKSSNLPAIVELNEVVEQLIESMLRPVLRESIGLQFTASQESAYVQVQRSELDTALLNLVLNARDAMPEGGTVSLRVKVHGQEVTVEVQDQGAGIDPRDLARVFEPNFSTKGEQGTGLGLSMVRGFALRSSGDIRAESSAEGTTFYLTLPNCPKPSSVPAGGAPRSKLAKAPRRATVLVVEDNPDLLRSTGRVVQDLGYRIECAQDADCALEVLKNQEIDILLSDIRMPGRYSGVELARQVNQRWPQVQTLLVTGHAPEVGDSEEFRVLRKPYAVRQLAEALHEAASEPWPAIESVPSAEPVAVAPAAIL